MLNSRAKKISKVIGINTIIIILLLIFPALFYRLFEKLKPVFYKQLNQTSDPRAYFPTYSNKEFSIELLNEFSTMRSFYRSFIGWKRKKVNFKYTKISGPYNKRKSKGQAINNSIWFFGGSTMWGTGSSDNQTIPSHFYSLTNIPVYNFGEAGWNSRQSLNQLINAIGDNHKPSAVIFYDGVNDVTHQCRSEYKLMPTHSYEKVIQENLATGTGIIRTNKLIKFILSPYIAFANKFNINYSSKNSVNLKQFDCDTNQAKALSIAKHQVNNWYTAYALSKSMNFEFYGILQPTLFTTKTNSDYFTPSMVKDNLKKEIQYKIVYPLIINEIKSYCEYDKNFCSKIIDGTDWLDGTNNIFIDFCHVNSLGNKLIAQRMKLLLQR